MAPMKRGLAKGTILVASIASFGCGSLAAKSARYVGCREPEIEVSGEARVGDAYLWTATCEGRVYDCSRSHRKTECTDRSHGRYVFHVGGAPAGGAPKMTDTMPPKGAAGFELGATVELAARACSDAGKSWTELGKDGYGCSGTPLDVGFAATVEVGACAGRVCTIKILPEPSAAISDLVARYAELRDSFKNKYGSTFATSSVGMSACAAAELKACFEDGRASASSKWTWSTGHQVELSIGKGSGATAPVGLQLLYRGPSTKGAARANVDNL
jgi:hypothetical protein